MNRNQIRYSLLIVQTTPIGKRADVSGFWRENWSAAAHSHLREWALAQQASLTFQNIVDRSFLLNFQVAVDSPKEYVPCQ